jgi:hypothetical protein
MDNEALSISSWVLICYTLPSSISKSTFSGLVVDTSAEELLHKLFEQVRFVQRVKGTNNGYGFVKALELICDAYFYIFWPSDHKMLQ